MRYSFFDSVSGAMTKFAFCALTYVSSILLVQFSIPQILPVILIFVLSNLFDYIDIAVAKPEKCLVIRIVSFMTALYGIVYAISIFSFLQSAQQELLTSLANKSMDLYFLTSPFVIIPLVDTIIGFVILLCNESRTYKRSITQGASHQDIAEYMLRLAESSSANGS